MVCIAQHKAKLEVEAFQSQREKIELESSSSYCVVLSSGCKSRRWESSLTSATMLPCNHPPVDEPAVPSHGSPSPSISQRNLNFTRLLLPALRRLVLTIPVAGGDFQGHYQDGGRGCEGRKDRTERGDGIVGCGGETWAETCPLRAAQCDTLSLRLHAEGRQQGTQPMWSKSRLQEWRGSFLKRHWQRDPSELTGRDIQCISHITPFHYPARQSKSCLGKAACWDITKVHLLLALTLHPVFPRTA